MLLRISENSVWAFLLEQCPRLSALEPQINKIFDMDVRYTNCFR